MLVDAKEATLLSAAKTLMETANAFKAAMT